MDEKLFYRIALTLLPGIGPISAKNLLGYCQNAAQVFSHRPAQLQRVPGIGPRIAARIQEGKGEALRAAEREMKFLEGSPDIRALFFLDEEFPRRLRQYPDCPFLLYCRGQADLNAPRIVSIVGTRKPSPYGLHLAEDLVAGLKPYGVSVVSGLAYGIDAKVHRACLENGLATFGVLGHGLQMTYPSSHRKLAREIVQKGALLTEFHSSLGPEKDHFPMRNRIVAGMCDALVVVETGSRGGSMISAEFANGYHKDVFALPGRVGQSFSKGCHFLIKTNRAGLVENAEDIAYRMQWDMEEEPVARQFTLFEDLDDKERAVVRVIREDQVAAIDRIARQTGIESQALAGLLLNLEFKGVIRTLPGHRYAMRR